MSDKPIKVLLIEDNPGDTRLIREMFAEAGDSAFDLEWSDRLSTGLERLDQGGIAVVLLDLGLPDSQGLDTLKSVLIPARGAPVVVLTGLADEKLAIEAVQQGAQDYLMKGQLDGNLLMTSIRYAIERQREEEALRQSEEKLRLTFEAVTEGIAVTDLNGVVIECNEKAADIYRVGSKDEVLGKSYFELIAHCDRERVAVNMQKTLEQGSTREIEYALLRADGSEFPAEVSSGVLKDASGNPIGIVAIIRDITERKQAEELYRTLASSSPVGIYIVQERKFVFANPQFQRYVGFTEDELLGTDPLALIHPEDREQVRKDAVEMLKGNRHSPYEFRAINKNGEARWAMETVTPIQYRGSRAALGNFMDITERKKMQEQLILTDRLASIGELASGIAHELNNPLTSVVGFSQLLLDRDIADDIRRDLEVVYNEAQRTAQVVKNLLTFARKHTSVKQPVNISSVIEKVLELRAYEQKVNNIQVITRFAPDLPDVMADYFQLLQVFLNIIINAEHSMIEAHNRGTLAITTERVGNIIRASFADDGPGIAKENLGHLFDPFFTTKEVGKGTGLGLSICHGIITEHGGRIYAESELGKGATFVVELPITDDRGRNEEF